SSVTVQQSSATSQSSPFRAATSFSVQWLARTMVRSVDCATASTPSGPGTTAGASRSASTEDWTGRSERRARLLLFDFAFMKGIQAWAGPTALLHRLLSALQRAALGAARPRRPIAITVLDGSSLTEAAGGLSTPQAAPPGAAK